MKTCLNVILAGGSAVFPEKAGKKLAALAAAEGCSVCSVLLSGEKAGGGYAFHLRIGGKKLSPVIPEGHADLLFAEAPGEALRQLSWLKPDGRVVTNMRGQEDRSGEDLYLRFLRRRVRDLTILKDESALHFSDIFTIMCNNPAP